MLMEEELQPIEVIDWQKVGEKAELKRGETGALAKEFGRIFEIIKNSRVVLVEVETGGALAAFNYFFTNISRTGAYLSPILGATTPYDLEKHKGMLGAKSCAWVTQAGPAEGWVSEKFNIIKPSNLFEITSFIKAMSSKTEEHIYFITDMFDEIYDLISEKEFHILLSRIHAMLKASDNSLIVVAQTSLYSKGYLALLERYADGKIRYGQNIDYINLRTNSMERLK